MSHAVTGAKVVVTFRQLAKYIASRDPDQYIALDVSVDVLDTTTIGGPPMVVEGESRVHIPSIRDPRPLLAVIAALERP